MSVILLNVFIVIILLILSGQDLNTKTPDLYICKPRHTHTHTHTHIHTSTHRNTHTHTHTHTHKHTHAYTHIYIFVSKPFSRLGKSNIT